MRVTGGRAFYEPRSWTFTPRPTSGDVITGLGPLPLGCKLGRNEFAKNWPLQRVMGLKYTETGIEITANGQKLPYIEKPLPTQAPGYWTLKKYSPLEPFDKVDSLKHDMIELVFRKRGTGAQHVVMAVEVVQPVGRLVPRGQAGPDALEVPPVHLTPEMRSYFLRSHRYCDFDREELRAALKPLGLIKRHNESRDEFVLRVVQFAIDKMEYTEVFDHDDRRPLHVLRELGQTNCNGIASFFAGILRANDIECGMMHGYYAGSGSHAEAWFLNDESRLQYIRATPAVASKPGPGAIARELIALSDHLVVSEFEVGKQFEYKGGGIFGPGLGGGFMFWDGPAVTDRPIFPAQDGGGNLPMPNERNSWELSLDEFRKLYGW